MGQNQICKIICCSHINIKKIKNIKKKEMSKIRNRQIFLISLYQIEIEIFFKGSIFLKKICRKLIGVKVIAKVYFKETCLFKEI